MKNPPRKRRVIRSRATPTGLEPAASAVTGRRSNQLSYGAKMQANLRAQSTHPFRKIYCARDPSGIRTRAAAVKGRSPGPLDDGASILPGREHVPARAK